MCIHTHKRMHLEKLILWPIILFLSNSISTCVRSRIKCPTTSQERPAKGYHRKIIAWLTIWVHQTRRVCDSRLSWVLSPEESVSESCADLVRKLWSHSTYHTILCKSQKPMEMRGMWARRHSCKLDPESSVHSHHRWPWLGVSHRLNRSSGQRPAARILKVTATKHESSQHWIMGFSQTIILSRLSTLPAISSAPGSGYLRKKKSHPMRDSIWSAPSSCKSGFRFSMDHKRHPDGIRSQRLEFSFQWNQGPAAVAQHNTAQFYARIFLRCWRTAPRVLSPQGCNFLQHKCSSDAGI